MISTSLGKQTFIDTYFPELVDSQSSRAKDFELLFILSSGKGLVIFDLYLLMN